MNHPVHRLLTAGLGLALLTGCHNNKADDPQTAKAKGDAIAAISRLRHDIYVELTDLQEMELLRHPQEQAKVAETLAQDRAEFKKAIYGESQIDWDIGQSLETSVSKLSETVDYAETNAAVNRPLKTLKKIQDALTILRNQILTVIPANPDSPLAANNQPQR